MAIIVIVSTGSPLDWLHAPPQDAKEGSLQDRSNKDIERNDLKVIKVEQKRKMCFKVSRNYGISY
jgi:hypothetical protein